MLTRWLVAAVALFLLSAAQAQQRTLPSNVLRSGIEFAGADVRSMQSDDLANPGFLWVERGEKLWNEAAGGSCASCHGDASTSKRGVAARYPAFDRGRAFYSRRHGQMNLSCAQCHDQNWGKRLYAETLSQGHGNAFPAYKLEWQTLGSLQRRIRACLFGIRAEMPPAGAPELTDLELFLAWRAQGLPLEAPGVRR